MLTNAVVQGAPFAHTRAFIQMFETHFSFNSVSMNYYVNFDIPEEGNCFICETIGRENQTCCLQDFCRQPATAELGIVPPIQQDSLQKGIYAFALHFWIYCQCSPGGDSDPPLPQKILENPQQQSSAHTALKGCWVRKQGRKKLDTKLRPNSRLFGLLFSFDTWEKKLQRTEQHLLRMLTTDHTPG